MTPFLPFLYALPWVLLALFVLTRIRLPPPLPAAHSPRPFGGVAPLVSVVIPARNEAHNIERVLASVTAAHYPRFEVLVVDDRSEDETGALARAASPGRAMRLGVLDGAPLPDGWLGKPWACAQGARAARGELLLFTDADTVHAPELLERAVAGLEEEGADALTLMGRQEMGSFWERLVQPHIFGALMARFAFFRFPPPRERWRDAIANGQFLLFRRDVYIALGGHEAVKDEVVEDLCLAQLLVRGGWRLSLRAAEDAFSTRMYRSLGELVNGWSKNFALGARQSVPGWARPVLLPAAFALGVGLWLAPPALLVAALVAGVGGTAMLLWGLTVVGVSALLWGAVTARMGAPFAYGLLYPVGAGVGAWILLRSWARGTRVEWKGREYRVKAPGG